MLGDFGKTIERFQATDYEKSFMPLGPALIPTLVLIQAPCGSPYWHRSYKSALFTMSRILLQTDHVSALRRERCWCNGEAQLLDCVD